MINRIINFFRELQNSDESTKKRWLVILSGTSMVVVVGLWLIYFSFSLERISPAQQRATAETSGIKETLEELKATLNNGIAGIKEQLNRTKSYDFTAVERNFILEKAGEVPKSQF